MGFSALRYPPAASPWPSSRTVAPSPICIAIYRLPAVLPYHPIQTFPLPRFVFVQVTAQHDLCRRRTAACRIPSDSSLGFQSPIRPATSDQRRPDSSLYSVVTTSSSGPALRPFPILVRPFRLYRFPADRHFVPNTSAPTPDICKHPPYARQRPIIFHLYEQKKTPLSLPPLTTNAYTFYAQFPISLQANRRGGSPWQYRPKVITLFEQTSHVLLYNTICTTRPTLLQSHVTQSSPSLPETRPSLQEASLARSPHFLGTSSLCDSLAVPVTVILRVLCGRSRRCCFGDIVIDGDWR